MSCDNLIQAYTKTSLFTTGLKSYMSCSNQIICYTSPHLSLHVPFFFLLIILTHCYVIVYSFYYPPLQAYLQYKKSLSNIIHLSHRQIPICTSNRFLHSITTSIDPPSVFRTRYPLLFDH